MREAHLRLDSIELALRELPGKLRLETEIVLGLPDTWPVEVTPEMISSKVAVGELWVERASPCRLHVNPVTTSYPGILEDDSLHERQLISAIRSCSAWELLGLQLSRCPRPMDDQGQRVPGSLFYITHISNSSNHLACQYTARAEIRRLTCKFCFDFATNKAGASARKQREPVHMRLDAGSRRVTRSRTRLSLLQLSGDIPARPKQLSEAEVDRSVMVLVKGSLYTLLGIKKSTHRIKRLRCFESPSLLEIAPAAFNMRYVQELIQRAPFLYSISSVLARLVDNAQSSSLKHKVASLATKTVEASDIQTRPDNYSQKRHFTNEFDSMEGIGKMIWPILQAGPSRTKLFLEKLPEDRVSNVTVNDQSKGGTNIGHGLSHQSEKDGPQPGERVIGCAEVDDTALTLHQAVSDMTGQGNSDLCHHLDEFSQSQDDTQDPEEAPFLDGEDQGLDHASQEHVQRYRTHPPMEDKAWQDSQQMDVYGDDYEIAHCLYEGGVTDDHYGGGQHHWAPERENEIGDRYLGPEDDDEHEAEEGHPELLAHFIPRIIADEHEAAGILRQHVEDDPERTDITAFRDTQPKNIELYEGVDGVLMDELGHEYVYEELPMFGCDDQNAIVDGDPLNYLTPWEWHERQRSDVAIDSWDPT